MISHPKTVSGIPPVTEQGRVRSEFIPEEQFRFVKRIIKKIVEPSTCRSGDFHILEQFKKVLKSDLDFNYKLNRLAYHSFSLAIRIPQFNTCGFGKHIHSGRTLNSFYSGSRIGGVKYDYINKIESVLHNRIIQKDIQEIIGKLNIVIPEFERESQAYYERRRKEEQEEQEEYDVSHSQYAEDNYDLKYEEILEGIQDCIGVPSRYIAQNIYKLAKSRWREAGSIGHFNHDRWYQKSDRTIWTGR